MSESDREISKVGGKMDHGDDDDDEAEEEEDKQGGGGPHCDKRNNNNSRRRKKKTKEKKRRGFGCEGYFIKAKKAVHFPFTKVTRTNSNNGPSSSENDSTSGEKKVIGSCFCLKQPSTLESAVDSQTSDPNDPKFTFDMLRTLIEENDFYSKECNPHLISTPNNNNFG